MRKVLIIDTSILCVWLKVPGKETCGKNNDRWNYERVNEKIEMEYEQNTLFVLPLATIIETGNHISQSSGDCYQLASEFAKIMVGSADNTKPWAAFSEQSTLWTPDKLRQIATEWPSLAAQRISLGDATIKDVAEYYSSNFEVEILTGDEGLKSYEPVKTRPIPRRRH